MNNSTLVLIFLSALISIFLSGFQYFFKNQRPANFFWILTFLRATGIFSVLLLLINPEITTTQFYSEKPNLILLVDNSTSIKNSGSEEEVTAFLKSLTDDPEIQSRFDVHRFTFGKDLSSGEDLDFSDSQTNIQKALKEINKLYKSNLSPTVLITDGNQTFGEDYSFEYQNFQNRIFPVLVGDTLAYRDLFISRINVNDYAFLNNQFPVELILNYSGNSPVDSRLQISLGNSTVYSKNVSFSRSRNSQVVKINLEASKIGVLSYKVELLPFSEEKNLQNNQQFFAVEVIDERTSVLLLNSLSHPDIGVLKRSIETNQQREVLVRHIEEAPASFGKFELVILYQPTWEFDAVLKLLEEEEKNYFIITGPETDWRFLNEAQSYFQKNFSNQTEDYFPELNRNYKSFQIADLEFQKFPPLEEFFGEITTISEQVDILLFKKVQGVSIYEPLLATIEKDDSRAAYLFGGNLWKWRAYVYSEEASFKKFDDFLGRLVQYLASNAGKERLTVNHENVYFGNQRKMITAHYFDKNYIFDPDMELTLEIKNESTGERQVIPFGMTGNKYQVELSHIEPSEYSYRVTAEGENFSKTGNFTVIDYNVEDQFTSANLSGLQQIAHNQNEELFFLDRSEKLKKALLSDINLSILQKSRRNHVSLIDWYYLLAITAFSFSAEWFLRKYHGLI